MIDRRLLWALCASALAGCGRGSAPLDLDEAAVVVVTKNPFAEVQAPRDDDRLFAGEVRQALRAGTYTYLEVRDRDGQSRWVVTMKRGFRVGSRVEVKNMGTRSDFYSPRLGRTFDELVFGVVRQAPESRTEGT